METSEMTCDLDHLDTSKTAFFLKLKRQQKTEWTNADSISAEMAFNLVVDILKPMSITFKKDSLFSMTVSKAIVIEDGKYTFDKANNNLILKVKSDTIRYNVVTLSDSSLVLLTTDATKAIITYKRQSNYYSR